MPKNHEWSLDEAADIGAKAVETVLGCPAECTKSQLLREHKQFNADEDTKLRPTTAGSYKRKKTDTGTPL